MSEKGAELVRLAERGGRVAEVREALGLNGDDFADAINAKAKERGYAAGYDKSKVSRLEAGKVTYLPAEDAVIIAQLDPRKRGVGWLVFGAEAVASRKPETGLKPYPMKPIGASQPATEKKRRRRGA